MKPKYTTYENQYPVYLRDLLTLSNYTEDPINYEYIDIHFKGIVKTNPSVMTHLQYWKNNYYNRIVNESYFLDGLSEAISFLNCETNESLFCLLFNKSLGDNKAPYHPLITDYELSFPISENPSPVGTISFKLKNKYELKHKKSHTSIIDDFYYIEKLSISITAVRHNIKKLNELFQQKLIPCDCNLTFKDIRINLMINQDHTKPVEIHNFIKYIDVKDTDILVTFNGVTPKYDISYHHNEAFRFIKFSVFKEFMEIDDRDDNFHDIFDIQLKNSFYVKKSQKIINNFHELKVIGNNFVIGIYCKDEDIESKIGRYFEKKKDE